MDKLRAEFEKWFNEEMAICVTESNATAVRLMWKAWQASRASIVVELPESVQGVSDPFDDGHRIALDGCTEALRSIGLSIKGE